MRELDSLQQTTVALREGCPWNATQTHSSLKKYLLEETYELLEAIDSGRSEDLLEELGDVLFQVLLHAQIASETEAFELRDVAERANRKMIHRHPHVFGGSGAVTVEDVNRNWDRLKADEKTRGSASPFAGVPREMPALARAVKILKKAHKLELLSPEGHTSDEISGISDRESLARHLLAVAEACRQLGLDPEDILRVEVAKIQTELEARHESASTRNPGS
jgi:XTP/dITP diphosphohydrolase